MLAWRIQRQADQKVKSDSSVPSKLRDLPLPGTSRRTLLPAALPAAHAAAVHAAHALTTHTLATHTTLTVTSATATMMVMPATATVIIRAVTGGQRQGQAGSQNQSKNLFHEMLHQRCFGFEDA
ncbi:hypothetical protein AA12467_1061 [Gluconobacter sphaericus NBRC 12467]|nr:hypothetical protein AA12467_1061 [Gluconobacter sphaericus NBRC 12467]